MAESRKTAAFLKRVRHARPNAFVRKLNDRTNAGLPDAIIDYDGVADWVEFKDVKPGAGVYDALTPLQRITLQEIAKSGGNAYVVAFRGKTMDVYGVWGNGQLTLSVDPWWANL
jgi:hypothetical protein